MCLVGLVLLVALVRASGASGSSGSSDARGNRGDSESGGYTSGLDGDGRTDRQVPIGGVEAFVQRVTRGEGE